MQIHSKEERRRNDIGRHRPTWKEPGGSQALSVFRVPEILNPITGNGLEQKAPFLYVTECQCQKYIQNGA
jgi:hypothetical protein